MLFLSPDETRAWSERRGYPVESGGRPALPGAQHCVVATLGNMNWTRLNWVGSYVASFVEPFEECLLWINGWGASPDSENWHLFYRLRQTYGERRMLQNAPGHLFFRSETAGLATFVQVALLCGWDLFLMPHPAANSAFLGSDGSVELYTDSAEAAQYAREWLEGRTVPRERATEAAAETAPAPAIEQAGEQAPE